MSTFHDHTNWLRVRRDTAREADLAAEARFAVLSLAHGDPGLYSIFGNWQAGRLSWDVAIEHAVRYLLAKTRGDEAEELRRERELRLQNPQPRIPERRCPVPPMPAAAVDLPTSPAGCLF